MPLDLRPALIAPAALALLMFSFAPAAAEKRYAPKQIVMISFDGANGIEQWQRSRRLAAITGARFTYFLSCVFLLSPEHKSAYRAPAVAGRHSNVGFALSPSDVGDRLEQIWQARSEGHDIASHGCGHFDGANWRKADWAEEFAAFRTILRDAWTINAIPGEPTGWHDFAERGIIGFRAPYLATGPLLEPALRAAGFRYDASGISRGPQMPATQDGLVAFALPQIPEGPAARRVIAMDYNLFVRHSGGIERPDRDGAFEERTFAAFLAAFETESRGHRTPLSLGFHFTLMNGGAYWRALERFAREVCVRDDVACISYADYVRQLGTAGQAQAGAVGG